MLIGFGGATSLISIRLGEERYKDAEQILANAFSMLVLISLALTVLGLLFFGSPDSAFRRQRSGCAYARDYLSIILYGGVFQALGFGLNHMIRAQGHPQIAMATMLIGAITNTILDPILSFGLGGGA